MWRKVGWEWGNDCHVVFLHIVMYFVHSSESKLNKHSVVMTIPLLRCISNTKHSWQNGTRYRDGVNGPISCLWCSGWHPHKCSTAPWLQDNLAGFFWLSIVSKTKAYLHSNYKAQSDHFLVQTILCLCSDVCTVWEEVTATKLLDGCTYHVLESR